MRRQGRAPLYWHLPPDHRHCVKLERLILKRGEDRRLRAGHLWVFSNEVDSARSPLTDFAPGQPVAIADAGGRLLGSGYVNPASLICARLISRDPTQALGPALLRRRLAQALALRQRLLPGTECYRLVYGEGDALPGLVVDRYGAHLVVQLASAGMDCQREAVVTTLLEQVPARSLLLRNDIPVRALEGLPAEVQVVHGEAPEYVVVDEGGLTFQVPLRGGQETGWFFDQRDNRLALTAAYVRGARVLDVFSYLGGWALRALAGGAAAVSCIEASAPAAALIRANAAANGLAPAPELIAGEAFAALHALHEQGRRFDVVILDPPAFIKRRREHKSGLQGYHRLHRAALRLLEDGGILVSASCSGHLGRDEFRGVLRSAALREGMDLQILRQGGLGVDHPVHPAIAETDYLKCLFARVLRR